MSIIKAIKNSSIRTTIIIGFASIILLVLTQFAITMLVEHQSAIKQDIISSLQNRKDFYESIHMDSLDWVIEAKTYLLDEPLTRSLSKNNFIDGLNEIKSDPIYNTHKYDIFGADVDRIYQELIDNHIELHKLGHLLEEIHNTDEKLHIFATAIPVSNLLVSSVTSFINHIDAFIEVKTNDIESLKANTLKMKIAILLIILLLNAFIIYHTVKKIDETYNSINTMENINLIEEFKPINVNKPDKVTTDLEHNFLQISPTLH